MDTPVYWLDKKGRVSVMKDFHTGFASSILSSLDASPSGLTEAEARRRLDAYGRNELRSSPPHPLVLRVLDQLRDPMILVLLGAAAVSLLASGGADRADALIILLIVVLNAIVSLTQEDGARRALDALEKMSSPKARLLRDGHEVTVDAALVVPGDVMLLRAGDRVPADGRLLVCAGLAVDESAMTGESVPVYKSLRDDLPADTPAGDRVNTVTASTLITSGRGRAVVTATGMDSRMGQIASLLRQGDPAPTPLQRRMGEVSGKLSVACLAVCAATFALGLLRGRPPADMFLTSVSLAVAAIPEGLPAVVSIVLALGVQRMARRGAIVRRLPAVETLGCAGVICSDKTGTLTLNRMTLTELWTPDGAKTSALTAAALCCDARMTEDGGVQGDPTESALLLAAAREGIDAASLLSRYPRTGETPFDSSRKYMLTVHARPEGGWRIAVKGAPDVLLPLCSRVQSGGGAVPLDDGARERLLLRNGRMAAGALRVLALAVRDVDVLPPSSAWARDLTFLGLAGLMDPPRPEVRSAVAQCRRAGIRPVMITGDHRATALAVAKDLDIYRPGDRSVTGQDLDFMPQSVLEEEIASFSVFARVTPEHKLRIVRAWQAQGVVAAMTGDGVNDAPALRAADVGCAMGLSGTDVARGAADVVLTDDDFSTVVRAVETGRGVYANVRKAIHYLLSCNVGELLTIFLASAVGLSRMPLLPVQLLWRNLVTDSLPALALGMERAEPDVMSRPPRRADAPLFDRRFTLRLMWQGLMVSALTLTAYFFGRAVMPAAGLADETANTMAFATLTLCQLFHAYNARSETRSVFAIGVASNPSMNRAFFIGMAMQLAVLCLPPLQRLFSVVPLGAAQWSAVLALSVLPVPVCELAKRLARPERAAPRRLAPRQKRALSTPVAK